MRRPAVVLATAALVGSTLAFAPAVTTQQAETDHAIVFTEDGSETVEGAQTNAGTNLGDPVGAGLPSECTKDPNTYCETVHVTVEQPVADEDPDSLEFGTGEVSFTLAPTVPGADFDINVFESDQTGTARDELVAESGNFPGCSVLCESPLGAVIGEGCGPDHDECGSWTVPTNDLAGGGTAYYVIEVVYYLAAGPYTLDVTYERTDGRNFDGTTPVAGEPTAGQGGDR